jgi:hypothetical protein
MEQTIINWILGGFGALLGFLLKSIWQAVKDLQSADKALADKVGAIEVLVAGNYVRRDDFDRMVAAMFVKLDRIEDKLGSKVDK